jgi:uncharacterized protein YcbK (DUF882 family)
MSTGPGPHLTWRELACHDAMRSCYPLDLREDGTARRLATVFEVLRQACGHQPLRVLSAYRTRAYNELCGGAPNSQHIHGRALDLQTPLHLTLDEFWRITQDVARMLPLVGAIGVYDWGIHLDIRPRLQEAVTKWDLRPPVNRRT